MNKEAEIYKKIGLQFFADGAGEEGAAGTGTDGGNAGTGGQGTNPPAAKTFTQDEVNTMMANEKRTARNAVLKELGYEVKDGKFKETMTTVKGILDSSKTQQQLDQEAKTAAEERATTAEGKAATLQAQVDVMKAGVKPEYVDDVIAMLLPKVTEEKPLSKLLEEYKTKYPLWYGESASQGTGGSTNPPRKGGTNTEGLGQRLAKANKPATKSSYFKN